MHAALLVTCLFALPAAEEPFDFPMGPGFEIEQVADASLADNIYSLTLDAEGRPYVSGPGYIRRLEDKDADGIFESSTQFYAGPGSGCMGMVWRDQYLYTTGGRGLERYEDSDGDGVADGPPKLLVKMATGGEHTSHGLRFGPDGKLYYLGGNHQGLSHSAVAASSPITQHYAGIFCRMNPDGSNIEVWCEGMRNAYDFDFAADGEAFGWDSDSERDHGLSWYRPCRAYHFTPGIDCAWRTRGTGKVPLDSIDCANPVVEAGRGSPTGVATYRHRAFPKAYQGGLFALDWTHGGIHFFALQAKGSTQVARNQIFLKAKAETPFSPTDIAVTRSGDLLVSSGGRGVSGAVFRISYKKEKLSQESPKTALRRVLQAASPLSEWSRKIWRTELQQVQGEQLLDAIQGSPSEALRALEIIVELYPDLAEKAIEIASTAKIPIVRRGAARWLRNYAGSDQLKSRLLDDSDAQVRRTMIDSLYWSPKLSDALTKSIVDVASRGDRRLRHAGAALLAKHGQTSFRGRAPSIRIVRALAKLRATSWNRLPHDSIIEALRILGDAHSKGGVDVEIELDALRLLDQSFDRLKKNHQPNAFAFDEAWDKIDLTPLEKNIESTLTLVRPYLNAPDKRVARQALLLCGRLRDKSAETLKQLTARLTADSPVADDVDVLRVLADLRGEWDDTIYRQVSDAAIRLAGKIKDQNVGRDGRWHSYLQAFWGRICERQKLAERVVEHDDFGVPDHLDILANANSSVRKRAALRLLERPLPLDVGERSRVLQFLIANVDAKNSALEKLLRAGLETSSLRPLCLSALSSAARPELRELFVDAIATGTGSSIRSAIRGLERLPKQEAKEDESLALLEALHRTPSTDKGTKTSIRRRLQELSGQTCDDATAELACFIEWAKKRFPEAGDLLASIQEEAQQGVASVRDIVERIDWSAGVAERGKAIFTSRACQNCHQPKGARVGPSLSQVGRRYPTTDSLLATILDPSRDVPERYRFREYELINGERVEGIQVYRSSTIVLITRDGLSRRLDASQVLQDVKREKSLMPDGLLAGLEDGEIADLVAYLRSL